MDVGMHHCIGWRMRNFCAYLGFRIHSGCVFQIQKSQRLLNVDINYQREITRALFLTKSISKEQQFNSTLQVLVDEKLCGVTQSESVIPQESIQDRRQFHIFDPNFSIRADRPCTPVEDVQMISDKEMERRLKIGKSNKGRTPWNKGKKHSEETRERISKRTREALKDPKVREKMVNFRSHSDASKAKISSALTKIWQERLKSKRSQEKWFLLWKGVIAEAAKVGSHDQQELEWDSYEKMKAESVSLQLKMQAEEAIAREVARLRAERVAKSRQEVAQLAKQNKRRKKKALVKDSLSRKKLGMSREKSVASNGSKLSRRLAKFHHIKKQLEELKSFQIDKVTKTEPVIESWDLEAIKTEIERRNISLAEQLRAVKDRKADFAAMQVRHDTISHIPVGDKVAGS